MKYAVDPESGRGGFGGHGRGASARRLPFQARPVFVDPAPGGEGVDSGFRLVEAESAAHVLAGLDSADARRAAELGELEQVPAELER